jgi:hypothetical protein
MVQFFETTWLFWWVIAFVEMLRSSLSSPIDEDESEDEVSKVTQPLS